MFRSAATIPGKPRVLVVNATCNVEGWETAFCDRVFNTLKRRGIGLQGEAPVLLNYPEELGALLERQEEFNCLLLFAHGEGEHVGEEMKLRRLWAWLSAYPGLLPKLLAVCTCERYDPEASQAILEARQSFAQLAVVPRSPLTPRAAGLFFIKFFSELDLHAEASITGKMVWFSHSKAREILKRRQLPGLVGVRC